MRIGLAGISGSGKSTVFHWLTGIAPDPASTGRGQLAVAHLADPRLDWLASLYHPRKTTYPALEMYDTPGIALDDSRDNARRLALVRESDALCLVLNGFSSEPLREWNRLREEFILSDLAILENRIHKLQEQLRKPRPAREKEKDAHELQVLERLKSELEAGCDAGRLQLTADQEKLVRSFQLLTLKPRLGLVNTADKLEHAQQAQIAAQVGQTLVLPALLELELSQLPPPEQEVFLHELGWERLHRDELLHTLWETAGLITYYTVSEEECRAWPLVKGQTVLDAAAQVHSDFARGFVRAEVIGFDDLRRAGSMKAARAQGLCRLEGKGYLVQDREIIYIHAHR